MCAKYTVCVHIFGVALITRYTQSGVYAQKKTGPGCFDATLSVIPTETLMTGEQMADWGFAYSCMKS